ncbi:MAG TPA: HEAT repeat domain-containing protein, partial [Polyangia bacterium]|nr:HEAT repeat domain-containing protein [Polyangia bacterium]
LLLAKAAVALGWLGGVRVPDRLGPLLDHPDPDVRVDAAAGLGLTRLPTAVEHLRKRLDVEPVARVRAQISRQIQVIEATLAPPEPKK